MNDTPHEMKVLDFNPVLKGGLAATARLLQPSGLVFTVNVLRHRKDPSIFFVLPRSLAKQSGAMSR